MGPPSDTTADWLAAVRGAVSEQDLLGVIRRYVSSRTPQEMAQVPADCRPRQPDSRDDILESAVVLARAELKADGSASTAAVLRQMAAVFAEASIRLTRMVERGANADPRPT
jgi:hypothetical protein